MVYTPPSGASVGLAFSTPIYEKPPAGSLSLEFDDSYTATLRQAGGIPAPAFPQVGFIVNRQRQNVFASGIPPPTFPTNLSIERVSQKVYPLGIPAPDMPEQALIYTQRISPQGIAPPDNPLPISRIRLKGGYNPPPASSVVLEFRTEAYATPPASSVVLEFGAEGYSNILGVGLGDQSAFGINVFKPQSAIYNITLGDQSAFGVHTFEHFGARIYPQGIAAPTFPVTTLFEKQVKVVSPSSIPSPTFPAVHKFDNRLTKVQPVGIAPPNFLTNHSFTNFTQKVSPLGIAPPSFPNNHSLSYGSKDWDSLNYSLMLF